jgi:hypothetical protein
LAKEGSFGDIERKVKKGLAATNSIRRKNFTSTV